MASGITFPLEGGCACKHIRYRMETKPLVVHCCHCRWCQRETGSAFVLNAIIEASRVTHLGADPILIDTPSESGDGQVIARCPKCYVAVWSNYGGGHILRFVRVGTLDCPDQVVPDVQIYTDSKLPWVQLPEGAKVFREYYKMEQVWSEESLERRRLYLPEIMKWKSEKEAKAAKKP